MKLPISDQYEGMLVRFVFLRPVCGFLAINRSLHQPALAMAVLLGYPVWLALHNYSLPNYVHKYSQQEGTQRQGVKGLILLSFHCQKSGIVPLKPMELDQCKT